MTYKAAILASLLALTAQAWAADPVRVGFRDGVYRGPQEAAASALLTFSSRGGTLPAGIAEMPLTLPVGMQPLSRDWVLGALAKQAPGVEFAWFGPAVLARAPALQRLDGAAVAETARAALEAALKARGTEYEVRPAGVPEGLLLNPGSVRLAARLPEPLHLHPRMAVPVDVYVEGQPVRSVTAWFAVKAAQRMAVFAHDMQAQQEPGGGDLRWEERDAASLEAEPLTDEAALAGKWLVRPGRAGRPVLLTDLAPAPLVRNRERVQVQVTTGPVAILAWGTAEGSGSVGDKVRVLVDKAEGPCEGRVIGRGVVQVGY